MNIIEENVYLIVYVKLLDLKKVLDRFVEFEVYNVQV